MKNSFIDEAVMEGKYLRKCLDKYLKESNKGLEEIRSLMQAGKIKKVLLVGMGSSYYAANCIMSYLNQHGIPTMVLNGFDAARYQYEIVTCGTLIVCISQSGKSWEIAELIDKVHDRAKVVGIFNKVGSRLDGLSDIKLEMFAEPEVFFANRSFLHSLAILNIMAHVIAGDDMVKLAEDMYAVADWIEDYIKNYDTLTKPMYEMAKDADMYDFVANGPSIASSYQGGIIFREGPRAKTASIELADYAHDWVLSVNNSYTVIMCVPDFTAEVEVRMYNTIIQKGGKVILITSNDGVQNNQNTAVSKHPRVRESLAPMMQIVGINFLMAYLLGEGWHR